MEEILSNEIRTSPIGLFRRNIDNIWETLYKNIGTFSQTDGSITPIGFLSNPYYNLNETTSWFKNDIVKQKSNTYIGYLKNVLSDYTLSSNAYRWRDVSNDSTGSKQIDSLDEIIKSINNTTINITDLDTYLGDLGNNFVGISMQNAYVANSKSNVLKLGISSDMHSYFGINSESSKNGNIYSRYNIDKETGRLNYNFHPTSSPIYNKSYPNIGIESGKWRNYYQLMSMTNPLTKSYILGSINSLDLIYELGLTNLNINLLNLASIDIDTYINKNNSRFNMFNTYFDKMSKGNTPAIISYVLDEYDNALRYKIDNIGNKTLDTHVTYEYAESESDQKQDGGHSHNGNYNDGVSHGNYSSNIGKDTNNDLISKTNKAFINGKYRTLISRFHSSGEDEKYETEINTAVDIWKNTYGMSHGRNLLKKDPKANSNINTYDDPYCRVWTHHHEYHTLLDAIRPFENNETDKTSIYTQKELAGTDSGNNDVVEGDNYGDENNKYHWNLFSSRAIDNKVGRFDTGRVRLGNYGVMNQDNGLVNFTPVRNGNFNGDIFQDENEKDIPIKKCMFSIENLAWKGEQGKRGFYRLSKEQTGPLGGRIMWFPPYNLTFNENAQANWNTTTFIGRGEPIYTYTDTQRKGNLKFSLLIDHPSVIDYWRLHHSSENGNGPDKRDLKGDEQTLLRFFAGCEVLIPQPFYFTKPKSIPKVQPIPADKKNTNNEKIVRFWVFFPNNYSGVDDAPNANATHRSINAIDYLLNGLGTQMQINENGKQKLIDLSTNMASYKYNNDNIGGYETRKNENGGISIITESLNVLSNDKIYDGATRKKSTTHGRILNSNINIDGISNKLATLWVRPNKWYNKPHKKQKDGADISEWYYRVDSEWSEQSLLSKTNRIDYLDNKSFGFNTIQGLDKLLEMAKSYNILQEDEINENSSNVDNIKTNLFVTLADMYCYFNDSAKKTLVTNENKPLYDQIRIEAIANALSHKISKVVIGGYASAQGYNNDVNEKLAKNRANTVKSWLKQQNKFKDLEDKFWEIKPNEYKKGDGRVQAGATDSMTSNTISHTINETKGTGRMAGDVNDEVAKFFRSAHVDIYYDSDSVTEVKESVSTSQNGTTSVIGNSNSKNLTQTESNNSGSNDNIESERDIDTTNNESLNDVLKRYDLESIFFKSLTVEDPVLHEQITEKIKYFDPAFHSITPEGFNSRLTFLQQCMRAGQTYSASDKNGKSKNANNMSFGRPPVCVLRIGDFYNTRIVIENLAITYEQWDLNMEGIGVQPMIADIDISFSFIGGSDLAGPISRLQNALSFNYYANTGVYDNRSEMIEYKDGKISKFKGMQFSDYKSKK